MEKVTFNGVEYNARHGGPFDRGSADSYYDREPAPHYYVGATSFSERITADSMTPEALAAYHAGYDYNEQYGSKKDYN
jgi:hypothetical protein